MVCTQTMSVYKWYATCINGQKTIYHASWDNIKSKVIGISGAKYKGFKDKRSAQRWLDQFSEQDGNTMSTQSRDQLVRKTTVRKTRVIETSSESIDSRNTINQPISIPGYSGPETIQVGKLSIDMLPAELTPRLLHDPIQLTRRLNVYTDGSYFSNTGLAGWANVFTVDDQGDERVVYYCCEALHGDNKTNNRAELMAILKSIKLTPVDTHLTIFTDSKYSISCLTDWHRKWARNGWMTSQGNLVLNTDIIKPSLYLLSSRSVELVHIRAHQGHTYNEIADQLAKWAAGGI